MAAIARHALGAPSATAHGNLDAAPVPERLFILPTRLGDGFRASIRGHLLELADPADRRLAPTPDDLVVAAIASDLAWSARTFLRTHGLPDNVSVSAKWHASEGDLPSLADVNVTVRVSRSAQEMRAALAAAFAKSLAARSLADPVVHISLEE